jgi:Sister chromatid cohesion protein Dcc1
VPDPIRVSLSHLDGLYLIDQVGGSSMIRYFPKHVLSFHPRERFRQLFDVRAKWEKGEVMAYIDDLATGAKELDAVILKHARVSRVGKTVYLTNRHAVVPY